MPPSPAGASRRPAVSVAVWGALAACLLVGLLWSAVPPPGAVSPGTAQPVPSPPPPPQPTAKTEAAVTLRVRSLESLRDGFGADAAAAPATDEKTFAPAGDVPAEFPEGGGRPAPAKALSETFGVGGSSGGLGLVRVRVRVPSSCPSRLQQTARQEAAAREGSPVQFVTFDPVPPRFGLTNQLITYTSAMFVALLSRRALMVPDATNPPFDQLVDVPLTVERLPCGLRIINSAEAKPDDNSGGGNNGGTSKKFPRVHLPSRPMVLAEPAKARAQMERQLQRYGARRGLRLSTVMWHVPYVAADAEGIDEHLLFQSIEFKEHIRLQAGAIRRALGGELSTYAVLHLRMEADVAGFKDVVPPTPQHFERWVAGCLAARIPESVTAVYVSAGTLPDGIEAVLNRTLAPRLVLLKKNHPGLRSRYVVDADSVVAGTPVTNHFDAAADLEVAASAAFVLSADYSSFARAIQLRRCPMRPKVGVKDDAAEARARIWTYDRHWTTLSPRDCYGGAQPLTSVPFYYAPGYTVPTICTVAKPARK